MTIKPDTSEVRDDLSVSSLVLRVTPSVQGDMPTHATQLQSVLEATLDASPEGGAVGSQGDLSLSIASPAAWIKTSPGVRTNTGWTQVVGTGPGFSFSATPGTTIVPGPGSAGTSSDAARYDHVHAIAVGSPATASGSVNAEGVAASVARADHVHRTEVGVESSGLFVGSRPSINMSGGVAVSDDSGNDRINMFFTSGSVAPGAGTPLPIVAGAVGDAGAALSYSREDHSHAVPVADAVSISGNASTQGTSTLLSRADHTHAVVDTPSAGGVISWSGSTWITVDAASLAAPASTLNGTAISPGASLSGGASASFAREDHAHVVTSSTASGLSSNINAEGASTFLSRADHTHEFVTGTAPTPGQVPSWNGSSWIASTVASPVAGGAASALSPASVSAAGTSSNYSREDHEHGVPTASAVETSAGANAEGASVSLARADHTHQVSSGVPSLGQSLQWSGAAWVPFTVVIPLPGSTPASLSPSAPGFPGFSPAYTREDHEHGFSVEPAVDVSGNASTSGLSSSLSRSDHTHRITSGAAPAIGQVPQWNGTSWVAATISSPSAGGAPTSMLAGAAAAPGVSLDYSREDHAHAVPVGAAVAISGNASAEGASTSTARADHTHQLTSGVAPTVGQVAQWDGANWVAATVSLPSAGGAASSLAAGATSAAGVAAGYSREDHIHAVPVASAVAISGNASAEGVSVSLSRADHTHQMTSAAPTAGQIPQWDGTDWVAVSVAAGGATWNAVLTAGNESGGVDPVLTNGDVLRGVDGAAPGGLGLRGGNATTGVGAPASFTGGSGLGGGMVEVAGGDSLNSSNRAGYAAVRGGDSLIGVAAGGSTAGYAIVGGGDAPFAGEAFNASGGNMNLSGGTYRTGIGGTSSSPGGAYFRSGQPDTSISATLTSTTGPVRITTSAASVGDMASTSGTETSTGDIDIDTLGPGAEGRESGDISLITGSVNAPSGNNPGDVSFVTGGMLQPTQSGVGGGELTVDLGLSAGLTTSPGGTGSFTAGDQSNAGAEENSPAGSWNIIGGSSASTDPTSPGGSVRWAGGPSTVGAYAGSVEMTAGASSESSTTGKVTTATDGVSTPKEDRTIETTTTSDAPFEVVVATLDGAGSFTGIDIEVQAHLTTGSLDGLYSRKVSTSFFRTTTVLQQISPRHIDSQSSSGSGAGWTGNLVVQGDNVVLQLVGATGTSIDWSVKMDMKSRVAVGATSGTPVPRFAATNSTRLADTANSYGGNYDSIASNAGYYLDNRIGPNTITMGPVPQAPTTIANSPSGYFTGMTLGGMTGLVDQVTNGGTTDALDAIVAAGPTAYDILLFVSNFRSNQDINPGAGFDWELLPGAAGTNPNLHGTLLEVKRQMMADLVAEGINTPCVFRMTHEGVNTNADSDLDRMTRFVRAQMLGMRQIENEHIAGMHPNFGMFIPEHYAWWCLEVGSTAGAGTGPLGPHSAYNLLTHPQSGQAGNRNFSWLNRSQGTVSPFTPNGHQNFIATILNAWIWAYVLWGIDPRQDPSTGLLTGDTLFATTTPFSSGQMLSGSGRIYGGHNTGIGNDPYNIATNPGGPPDSALDIIFGAPEMLEMASIAVAAVDRYFARQTEFD